MSLLGPLFRPTSTGTASKNALRSVMTVQHPTLQHQAPAKSQERSYNPKYRRRRAVAPLSPPSTEDIFFGALAQASLCRKHARCHSTAAGLLPAPSDSVGPQSSYLDDGPPASYFQERWRNTSRRHRRPHPFLPKQLKDLVGVDDTVSKGQDQELASYYAGSPSDSAPDVEGEFDVPKAGEATNKPSTSPTTTPGSLEDKHIPVAPWASERAVVHNIEKILYSPTAHTSHRELWKLYQSLPHPGVACFSPRVLRKFFRVFSVVQHRLEDDMLRYMALVDDMNEANLEMTSGEWNSAITYAGRWVKKVRDLQVETAMQVWIRMEREGGVPGNHVTFNVLFDIATKAGKFELADVIRREMHQRGMAFNRYFRVSLIHHYGVRGDGAGVRRAYKDFIDAGEYVNTSVLNCVISSLIRAGEAPAAEHVFERMKALNAEKSKIRPAPKSWLEERQLHITLAKAAMAKRKSPDATGDAADQIQDATPVAPNMHTYRLLIRYNAEDTGNIDRVTELFEEMQTVGVPLQGMHYYHFFRGFSANGGFRYSSWNKARLDKVWAEFLSQAQGYRDWSPKSEPGTAANAANDAAWTEQNGAEKEKPGFYIDNGIIIAVLKAYIKCAGRNEALRVWEEILQRWKPSEQALYQINAAIAIALQPSARPAM